MVISLPREVFPRHGHSNVLNHFYRRLPREALPQHGHSNTHNHSFPSPAARSISAARPKLRTYCNAHLPFPAVLWGMRLRCLARPLVAWSAVLWGMLPRYLPWPLAHTTEHDVETLIIIRCMHLNSSVHAKVTWAFPPPRALSLESASFLPHRLRRWSRFPPCTTVSVAEATVDINRLWYIPYGSGGKC